MNEQFLNYEQSLAVKELEFNEPTICVYDNYGNLKGVIVSSLDGDYIKKEKWEDRLPAPLKQQVFEFFRDKYKMVHEIIAYKDKSGLTFDYDIFSLVLPTDSELGDENDIATDKSMETYDSLVIKDIKDPEYKSYEEAETACIDKLIELIKQRQFDYVDIELPPFDDLDDDGNYIGTDPKFLKSFNK